MFCVLGGGGGIDSHLREDTADALDLGKIVLRIWRHFFADRGTRVIWSAVSSSLHMFVCETREKWHVKKWNDTKA